MVEVGSRIISSVALITWGAATVFMLFFVLLMITGYRYALNRALALLILPFGIWSFGNALMFSAPDVQTAIFWDRFTSFGWALFPVTMLHFTFIFTKFPLHKISGWLRAILYASPPMIFIPAQFHNMMSIADVRAWYGWTVRVVPGVCWTSFTILYVSYIAVALFLLFRYARISRGYERKRALVVFWSYLIAFVLSSFSENLFPIIGVHNIPPLAPVFSLLLVVGVLYAIVRYNLLLSWQHSWILLHSFRSGRIAVQSVLDSSPHLSFVLDKTGLIHHFNRNAAERFSDKPVPLFERPMVHIIAAEEQERFKELLASVTERLLPDTREMIVVDKDNIPVPTIVTVSPLIDPDNALAGFVVTVVDITEWKAVEKQLKEAEKLAVSANKAKSEFLATISHEFRTPMNAILGLTTLLKDSAKDEKTAELLDVIECSGRHLVELIGDLLNLSTIESGRISLMREEVVLSDYVDSIAKLFPQEQHPTVSFTVDIDASVPASVIIDPKQVRNIVVNLLSNAFKFTERGAVVLRISWYRQMLEIAVSDTGRGISQEEQKVVFSRFVRGKDAHTAIQGSGIGLAVVRELVQLMEGELSVESAPGKGSTFTVKIPTGAIVSTKGVPLFAHSG